MENFKNNKKFQDIVNTSKELFWKFGIKRVTIEEICTETPVSKMTFYKFFKNKEVLAEYILGKVLSEWQNQYKEIMNRDIPFVDKTKEVINLKQVATKEMSEEFIKDIMNNEFLSLQELFTVYRKASTNEFKNDLIYAQKQGDIRKDIKPELILYLLDDINNMVMDEKLSKLYPSKQELIMELTNYFFYGIMNNKE